MNPAVMLPVVRGLLPAELREAFAGLLEVGAVAREIGPPATARGMQAAFRRAAEVHRIPVPLVEALAWARAPRLPDSSDVGTVIVDAAAGDREQAVRIVGAYVLFLLRGMDPDRAREVAEVIRGG